MHLGRKCVSKYHSLTYYRKYFLNFNTTESDLIGQRDKFKDPKSNRNKCVSQISLISGIKRRKTPQILPKKSTFKLFILPSQDIAKHPPFLVRHPLFSLLFPYRPIKHLIAQRKRRGREEDNKTDVT